MAKHRAEGEGDFTDDQLDELWKQMEEESDEDPEDD